ncbi:hypothetical protein F3168_04385 [Polymorphobacter fuscus]|uniref:Uncharacterized protein n=1 Tax=Sandarakinorhabdus fusca TaxID=1439888 RepID=A0A7C9GN71_9SPHN|nr:hypothetical protein F9290_04385 [Polymorphobacter fuscus]MQT16495.1 hypothetical protein [Polymorphobacter fuscus]
MLQQLHFKPFVHRNRTIASDRCRQPDDIKAVVVVEEVAEDAVNRGRIESSFDGVR